MSDPFAVASPALHELAARGQRHSYRKGRLLIEEGELGDSLYIVLSGRLRVFSAHPDNGREITYGSYGPGEYVGEMSLDGGPRSASVEATVASVCAVVPRDTLRRFITERPEFAFELLAKVIRRARIATLTARQLALNDAYGNLKAWLDGAAQPLADGSRLIDPLPSQRELGFLIGRSREMISRLMKDLERGGYVQKTDRRLVLLKNLPARW